MNVKEVIKQLQELEPADQDLPIVCISSSLPHRYREVKIIYKGKDIRSDEPYIVISS